MSEQKFLLEGWRALKEVLNSSFQIELVAVLPQYRRDGDYGRILGEIERRKIPIKEADESQLEKVSATIHSQGVVAVVRQQKAELTNSAIKAMSLIVAADNISDPGNLGSIIRTVDWFSGDLILLSKQCVEMYNEKVVRSTAGSIFHVPVVEEIDLPTALTDLKRHGFHIVSLSSDGKQSYEEPVYGKKNVFVFGSEAHGVSSEVRRMSDAVVKIPKFGQAESLNVGVVCGIVLAHAKRVQRGGGRSGS